SLTCHILIRYIFYQSCPHHRDLRSFPTRRSSDLKAAAALRQEVNTLHALTENYNKTLQERLDNETKVKRLLVHICNNITHYMHCIWNMEPPDQRYLRLYKVQVPLLELESRSYRVNTHVEDDIFQAFRTPGTEKHKAFLHGTLK